MSAANALRLQIERTLENRFPAALSPMPQTVRETAPVGIAEIDRLLAGGLPVGAISEITGPATSGRTCLALAFIAERTREGKVCAWVDVNDALDPESAAANGVCLRRLLWVRCRSGAEVKYRSGAEGEYRSGAEAKYRPEAGRANAKPQSHPVSSSPVWSSLDQALRAIDLLLQAGGFAAIVLDIGDTAEEHGRRIPLATWYRFRQAAEQARSCLVVLGSAAYAQSSAEMVLECAPREAQGESVLQGFAFDVELKRQRAAGMATMRKPPASVWTAPNAWASGAEP